MNLFPHAVPTSFRSRDKIKLDNPLHCGYMLTFCETEFNKENLSFIIEVDRLRDNILIDETNAWTSSNWRDIDAQFGFRGNFLRDANVAGLRKKDSEALHTLHQQQLHSPPTTGLPSPIWPSKTVDKRRVEGDVKRIWEEYIERNSPSQICLSSTVIERTAFRMKHLHIYGPDVFTEAVEEHMVNTVEADTLPRFSNSEIFLKMSSLLCTLYTAETLEVPSPPNSILQKSTIENLAYKLFQLFEILSDGILYHCFLRYLKEYSAERCLLCLQMISIFEDSITACDSSEESINLVEQYTWEIYRYFVTRNSAFEIILSERDRKEIMRNLAKPVTCMFTSLRQISYRMLETHFEVFSKTDQYCKLNLVMLKALQNAELNSTVGLDEKSKPSKTKRKVGCFNF